MIIMGYVNMIEGILEGKSNGVLDIERKKRLLELLGRLKKKDDIRNVADMAMWYFSSCRYVGLLNSNNEQIEKYSDYLSALAEVIHTCFSK